MWSVYSWSMSVKLSPRILTVGVWKCYSSFLHQLFVLYQEPLFASLTLLSGKDTLFSALDGAENFVWFSSSKYWEILDTICILNCSALQSARLTFVSTFKKWKGKEQKTHSDIKRSISCSLTFEFFPPLRADCREYVLWTTCSGVEGDLSEEWSEPFSTMFSPSWVCGVGERERLRRTGEQAGVLLFELLAVLKGQKEKEW